jgi:hypothetical protein
VTGQSLIALTTFVGDTEVGCLFEANSPTVLAENSDGCWAALNDEHASLAEALNRLKGNTAGTAGTADGDSRSPSK